MIESTLCFVLEDEQVLLIEKRRGLGEGWYNGPGGKLENGETARECAVREVKEEVGLEVPLESVEKAGHLTFTLDGEGHIETHVFRTWEYAGTPQTTPEAYPEWVPFEDVPYDQMWDDDRYWLPEVLEGDTVEATFEFEGGAPLDEADLVAKDLEFGVDFEV
ncbi:8-oxo-dGTP diphosphatase [Natrialbaceae archaeon A-chndr2]